MNTRELILSDFRAYKNSTSFFREYIINRGLRVTTWFRIAQAARKSLPKVLFLPIRTHFRRISRKYGVDMPVSVIAGHSLRIFHGFGLVLNGESVLGNHVTLQHGVTLGGKKDGAPVIGNNVQIMPGSKLIGKIHIGNNVIVGANSVVTKDVPDNAVIAGVPFKILYYAEPGVESENS